MTLFNKKVNFVKFIIKHDFIEDDSTDDFFRYLFENKEYLNNIDFSKGKTKLQYKYKMYINLRNGIFIFEYNGKKYNDRSLLRSIMRLIRIVSPGQICICIMDNYIKIVKKLEKVCLSHEMVENVIMDAFIDFLVSEEKKRALLEKIDESLDSKNQKEFESLIKQYHKLLN